MSLSSFSLTAAVVVFCVVFVFVLPASASRPHDSPALFSFDFLFVPSNNYRMCILISLTILFLSFSVKLIHVTLSGFPRPLIPPQHSTNQVDAFHTYTSSLNEAEAQLEKVEAEAVVPTARKTTRGRWVSVSGPSAMFDTERGGAAAALRGRRGRRIPHMQSVVSALASSGSTSAGGGGSVLTTLPSVLDRFRRGPSTLAAENSPRSPFPTTTSPSPLIFFEPASMPALTPEIEFTTLPSVAEAPAGAGGNGSPTNGGAHTPIAEVEDEIPDIVCNPPPSVAHDERSQRQRRSGFTSVGLEPSKSIDEIETPIP